MTKVVISYLDYVAKIPVDVSVYVIIPLLQPATITNFDIGFYELTYLVDEVKNPDECLRGVCKGGHLDFAKYMIKKGAREWNWGLFYACKEGHLNLVKLMVEKGANNWNYGLYGACKGGHLKLVNLMIEKGATYCAWCNKSIQSHGPLEVQFHKGSS